MFNSNIVAIGLAFILSFVLQFAHAENVGILNPGDAAVTGFSGTLSEDNSSAFFDGNGPSVRIILLPNAGDFGLREAAKHFTVTANQVGQVFGIALSDEPAATIFVAATSAYGLAIHKPSQGRLKRGAAGAQYLPQQFGPADTGGGASSIWRIDGKTGEVTLFANVGYNGIENKPASLGGLAFDPVSQQLFVADRTTGMIHRFSMAGQDQGIFDHGVQGLTAAGQQIVPFDPATLANISSPNFNTENPQTWGYAPIQRRVFALAMHARRLFYSVSGSQIWSVGIAADGSFAEDARFELESQTLDADIEISSIAFDQEGYLYIAERGAPTGDYHFMQVAQNGQNRVKRFAPKIPTDDSRSYWAEPGDEYAIGMFPEYQNANGGVSVTCGETVWSTGDHLLDTGAEKNFPYIDGLQGNDKKLVKPANMPPLQSWFVNYYDTQADPNSRGHMGAIVTLTRCNGYAGGGGYGGYAPPLPPPLVLPPPTCQQSCCSCPCPFYGNNGYCDSVFCPPLGWDIWDWPTDWTFGGFCNFNCWFNSELFNNTYCGQSFCPPIFRWPSLNGYCHFNCLFNEGWGNNNFCGPTFCSPEFNWPFESFCPFNCGFYENTNCITPLCPPFFNWPGDGFCNCPYYCPPPPPACPPEMRYENGECVHPCPPNQTYRHGRCVPPPTQCPPGETYRHGHCVPPETHCPPGETYRNGDCVPPETHCPPGETYRNGHCYPPRTQCPQGLTYYHGKCIPPKNPCSPGQTYRDGQCFPRPLCPYNQKYMNGRCVTPPLCKPNQRLINGRCVTPPLCKPNQRLINGRCVTPPLCKPNQRLINGRCVTPPLCKPNQRLINGRCVTSPLCKPYQRLINGRCVNPLTCPPYQRLVNGRCITPPTVCKDNQKLINGRCVTSKICGRNQVMRNGQCVTVPVKNCPSGQIMSHGYCVPKLQIKVCPRGQYYHGGHCVTAPRSTPSKNQNPNYNTQVKPNYNSTTKSVYQQPSSTDQNYQKKSTMEQGSQAKQY